MPRAAKPLTVREVDRTTWRKRGAKVIEATPVDEDSPSYRFMGFVPRFEEAGFTETGREGTRRHRKQRRIRATPKRGRLKNARA